MKAIVTHAHVAVNPGKLELLDDLHIEYRAYVRKCLSKMIDDRRTSVDISDRRAYFPASPSLSSQILKNAQAHAVFILDAWVRSLYARVLRRRIDATEGLTDQQRVELKCCGKRNLTHPGVFGRMVLTEAMAELYWSWVWDPEIVGNPPEIKKDLPMWMTEMTCEVQQAEHAGLAGWWFKFSSLIRRKITWIPLALNPRMKDGLAKTVLVKKRKGRWTFQFCDKTPAEEFDGSKGKIGVDVGLNVIAATSDGRLLGREFKAGFDALYAKVLDLRANRQRQGLKENSPKLDRLEEKLTGRMRTATATVANRLVAAYPGHTFVIEDLDLRGCRGQKRFCYRGLHRALSSKTAVETVNPAYTSQECPSCGHVSRANRRGVRFDCRSCGRKSHADVVGGLNLLGRSEDKGIRLNDRPSVVKARLGARFLVRRTSAPIRRVDEPEPSGRRLTVEVSALSGDPHSLECGS